MGLVARAIEAAGIPTVAVTVVRAATAAVPAPRNVFVAYRMGQVFGEPGRAAQQRTIAREALRAVERISKPGEIIILPYRWKRERFSA